MVYRVDPPKPWNKEGSDPVQDMRNYLRACEEQYDFLMEHQEEARRLEMAYMRELCRRHGYELTDRGEVVPLQDMSRSNDDLVEVDLSSIQEELPKKTKNRGVRDHIKDEDLDNHPSKLHILAGLQSKPVYQGTVFGAEKEKRRARNKRARAARRAARK